MTERMIEADGVELCTESFGSPSAPPILLIMGTGASMMWWEDGFCEKLAERGRFVIRYDHRDTGQSTSYEPGHPRYGPENLVRDAVTVLDGYEVPAAHLIGLSMGGALAQLVALEFPDRVSSLVLITTSVATRGDRPLPPPSDAYLRFLANAIVDWSDAESVVRHVVDHWQALSGGLRPFDGEATRALAERDVRRARNFASAQNHDLLSGDPPTGLSLSALRVPTLVIHGTADPLFSIEHGIALADEIPGAKLLTLPQAGHGLWRDDWDIVAHAVLMHTKRMQPSACPSP